MSVVAIAPGQSKTFEALRAFLLAALPSGVEVFQAQGNHVPEPAGKNFVIMTPISRQPLSTNINVYADAAFEGHASGSTLVVTAMRFGSIETGAELFAPGLDGVKIVAPIAPAQGGVGSYTLSSAPGTLAAPLAAGVKRVVQPVQRVIQLDVHSDDLATAGDMAQRISQLFRDEMAGKMMAAVDSGIAPLYADDARQMPFTNAEQEYESRWVVDANLQVNDAVDLTQQFADDVKFNLYPVL